MTKKSLNVAKLSQQEQLKSLEALFKAQPDVLEKHPKLLELLTFSDPTKGNITSLTSRQSSQLKTQLNELREQTKKLLHNAKHYDQLSSRIFEIIHEIIACTELFDAAKIIVERTPNLFDIDFSSIAVEHDVEVYVQPNIIFDQFLQKSEPYMHVVERLAQGKCLCSDRFPNKVLSFFFEEHADQVGSAAFMPLIGKDNDPKKLFGVLAFASKDKQKFSSQLKGTIHLERLGKTTALSMERIISRK